MLQVKVYKTSDIALWIESLVFTRRLEIHILAIKMKFLTAERGYRNEERIRNANIGTGQGKYTICYRPIFFGLDD